MNEQTDAAIAYQILDFAFALRPGPGQISTVSGR